MKLDDATAEEVEHYRRKIKKKAIDDKLQKRLW
jgi:hypothetical protein